MLKQLKTDIKKLADPKKAKILARFFKTGKGQYGAGDIFLGITVPEQRKLVKKYWRNLNLADLDKLLRSKIHEERLIALLVLTAKYQSFSRRHPDPERSEGEGSQKTLRGDSSPRLTSGLRMTPKKIFRFYLNHTKYINNWDLVDLSAPNVVGEHLLSLPKTWGGIKGEVDKNRTILYRLAKSTNLWERRIAILSTFAFIKKGDSRDTLKLAKMLLSDKHDLIHKAVGWMLREAGKRCDEKILTEFLDKYSAKMPRTMLRYAIERLPEKTKKHYLQK